MPPVPPDYRMRARRRMAQGLNPAAVEARNRFLASRGEHHMQSQPMQPANVRLSNGNEVSRDVVDRVKARWQAALKMAQQMDAPPPGRPGGPPLRTDPHGLRLGGDVGGYAGPRIRPSAAAAPGVTLTNSAGGTDPAGVPAMTPGLQKFLAQMAARRRGRR